MAWNPDLYGEEDPFEALAKMSLADKLGMTSPQKMRFDDPRFGPEPWNPPATADGPIRQISPLGTTDQMGFGDLKAMDDPIVSAMKAPEPPEAPPSGGLSPILAQAITGATSQAPEAGLKSGNMPPKGAVQSEIEGNPLSVQGNVPGAAPQGPSSIWGAGLEDEDLRAAQGLARKQNLFTDIGSSLSGALATMTGTKANPELYASLRDRANQGVSDIKDLRKAKVEGMSLKKEIDLSDPNSPVAQAYTSVIKKMIPGIETKGMNAQQMSEIIQRTTPWLDVQAKMAATKASKEIAQSEKSNKEQQGALQKTVGLLEQARGNPAAAQAERDLYSADKADDLAKLYGDPNKLSSPQVRLLTSEMAKMAHGGVPTMSELEGLNPNTFVGKVAEKWSEFSNSPTPAKAGAFVKQYQDYVHSIKKEAQRVIEDKYGRIIDTNKRSLNPSDYESLKQNYLNRFKKSEPSEGAAPQKGEYTAQQLAGIKRVAQQNNISEDDAIAALKKAGKL